MTTPMTGARRPAFNTLLVAAMASATFTAASIGILATFIIDDLSISRTSLGVVLAVVNVAAAVLSPIAGRITDRLGGKAAIVALFVTAGVTFLVLGTAVGYAMLLAGAVIGAFSQASANPATNRLIAEEVSPGERGLITGVKQSGVQAGIFIGGMTVPSLALTVGWRGAYLIVAAVPLMLVFVALWAVPTHPKATARDRTASRARLPAAIWWLAAYGLLLGFSGGVTFLVPLYTEEVLGLSPIVGGIAAGVIALVAVPGRILWSRFAERAGAVRESLGAMAALSVVAAIVFYASGVAGGWLLWPATVLIGVGSSSWNSVGMLAVMTEAGTAATGRASGVVLFGFLTGLGLAPPVFGGIVDRTGSYDAMWLLSGIAALAAGAVIVVWRRTSFEA